ncbi:Protein of unknown function DUF2232, membrane [Thioalkalivibrio sp. K90mix]|uniref:DUF2232 domain-containing protein n=1 Tax=unclassified Thioalkalivibrio TaxID=2621013 RepID=UPI0001959FA0|nr:MULTISPECIES: DUF2232 domain-containing protein [unclassified Thioalkalivibrio]ADC72424.1 Protein of unknown function DUF2232, membrane [Thioalkalivibrio sp. K90mix]
MRVLAEFVMKSRGRAVGAVSGFGVAGLFLPPIAIVSSALIALVGLRVGLGQALLVAALSALVLGAAMFVLIPEAPPMAGVAAGFVQWAPVVLLAEVLRRTVSWRMTLKAGAMVAGLGVLAVHALVPDLQTAWSEAGMALLGPLVEGTDTGAQELEAALRRAAPYLTGLFAGIVLLSLTLSLLIGRYWQALLYNPGAFGEEFRALQFGRAMSGVTVGLGLIGHLGPVPLATELAFILGVLFFLQGIALVHALTHHQGMSSFWLVGMYVLMALALPQMFLLLATIGVIDAWADIRSRLGALGGRKGPGDDGPDGDNNS